jgi:hypothetical protein
MRVPNTAAGQQVACTLCGTDFAVPGQKVAAPANSASRAGAPPAAVDLPAGKSVEGWFVETADGAEGPLSNEDLIALARQGKIGPETVLRHSRSPKSLRASEVPGLIPGQAAAPGPAQASAPEPVAAPKPAPARPAAVQQAAATPVEDPLDLGGPPMDSDGSTRRAKPSAPLIHRPPRSPVVPILLAVVGLVAIVLVAMGVMSSSGDLDLTKSPEDTLKKMVEAADSMKNGDDVFVDRAIAMHKEGKSWGEIDRYMIKFEGESVYVDHPTPSTQQLYIDWRDAMKKAGQ